MNVETYIALLRAQLDAKDKENERLREAVEEYMLWRPCEKGHAAAHRKLGEALARRSAAEEQGG